jgi:peroxiredoxin Q/BCP
MGVSTDSAESHQKFKLKFGLPFYLLVDKDHTVAEKYGAWGEKKMYGKTSEGLIRSTFIIDEKGTIIKVFPKVKPDEHAREVLEFIS